MATRGDRPEDEIGAIADRCLQVLSCSPALSVTSNHQAAPLLQLRREAARE